MTHSVIRLHKVFEYCVAYNRLRTTAASTGQTLMGWWTCMLLCLRLAFGDIFAYWVMPLGLTNSPDTFQHLMSHEEYPRDFLENYMDDLCK